MCIDAPESTTNSRSSGLRFDAGKHLFSEGEKNAAVFCSFNFRTLLARAPSCFAGTLLLPLCLLLRPILKFWSVGATLMMVHLGISYRAKDFGLEFWYDVQRPAPVNFTRWIGFCMSELFRKIDEDFGGSISSNTQPNCRVFDESCIMLLILLQDNHCTFVTILFGPFCLAVHQTGDAHKSTFPQICNHSRTCKTSILEVPLFTE